MQFNFKYDYGFGAGSNAPPSAMIDTLNLAANYLATIFTDRPGDSFIIDVRVDVGKINTTTLSSGTIAASLPTTASVSYNSLISALNGDRLTADDFSALLGLPTSSSTTSTVTTIQGKALGLISTFGSSLNGYLGFGNVSFDYNHSDGIAGYDFFGIAVGMLSNLMGRTLSFSASGTVMDLLHFSAPGVRSTSVGGYISLDNGVTRLGTLNNASAVGSLSDWTSIDQAPDAFRILPPQNTLLSVTPNDLRLLDALGYDRAVLPTLKYGDFNRDGKADILLEDKTGTLIVWSMNGAGIAGNQQLGAKPNGELLDNAHDFSGDGFGDLLWRDASGIVAVTGTYAGQQISNFTIANINSNWRFQGSADFNGDKKADVIWREVNGGVSLWAMNDGKIASNTAMPTIDNSWRLQGLGDFNGDGKSDVLWRHITGQIVFWQMDGSTIKDNQALQSQVDLSWHVAGTGDFNGDGKTDIVWRHNSGFVSLWTMDGYNIATNTAIADVSNNWQIQAIADYNGDGKSDLIWRDTSGFISVWQMDGSGIAANLPIGLVSNDYKINEYHTPSIDLV